MTPIKEIEKRQNRYHNTLTKTVKQSKARDINQFEQPKKI
jgi:hypothetical protein